MRILTELRQRFTHALTGMVDAEVEALLAMVQPAKDARHGDYQANCAMPLQKPLGRSGRDIAAEIVARLDLDDLCLPPEIAGPGFINLKLKDDWIRAALDKAFTDPRLAVDPVSQPRTIVIDYSSPNVAKPMHVGHIRSTVIGNALARLLGFLGHRIITDNHLGDWGTQFGMIIYGYKHFLDARAYEESPVVELGRLYRVVNAVAEHQASRAALPQVEAQIQEAESELAALKTRPAGADKKAEKQAAKALRQSQHRLDGLRETHGALRQKCRNVEEDPTLRAASQAHPEIAAAALQETARLHAGDPENRRLWNEFLPKCRAEIQRIYERLDVAFDYEYGESFYHDRLAAVVEDLRRRDLARDSEDAVCVFLDGFETPMIIQKSDGAFLYATTDLATIQFRMETWQPDAVLYVVDFRQGEHFDKLFAAARQWGYDDVELKHVSFGTVTDDEGKPFKTRAGDTVGLDDLLDTAVERSYEVVRQLDDAKAQGPELDESQRRRVASVIGHAAIKYADLAHNRTSDYKFSYDKMVALKGNTATYMQYSYARVCGIVRRGHVDLDELRARSPGFCIDHPLERELALILLRFGDVLDDVAQDYRPNLLTSYLFELAQVYSRFFENCPVLKAESETLRHSRLALSDLVGRTLRQGLELLGIDVLERM